METTAIAQTTGLSVATVHRVVREQGLHHRKPYRTPAVEEAARVRDQLDAGSSVAEAAVLDIS